MFRRIGLAAVILAVALIGSQALQAQMGTDTTTFRVTVRNVSTANTLPTDEGSQPAPLAPGVWALHTSEAPLFEAGSLDRGHGLEALAEDGNPADLASSLQQGQLDVLDFGVFNQPVGSAGPGPLTPGNAYQFEVTAEPGTYLSFATMLVPSNDLFYAPDEQGIPLFDATGSPINGVVQPAYIQLWDAGTEVNQPLGSGSYQAPLQPEPDTGPSENGLVQRVRPGFQGQQYPDVSDVIQVTISPTR